MGSRVDVNPELVLRAVAGAAEDRDTASPYSLTAAIVWAVAELDKLRGGVECTHETEIARLRTALESRTPTGDEWEHAAQLLHRWCSDIRWCSASESQRQRSRTRVAQIGVELGLID